MARPDPALSQSAQEDEKRMSRMDLLDSAYQFVKSREWPEGYSVYDVISMARYLNEEKE